MHQVRQAGARLLLTRHSSAQRWREHGGKPHRSGLPAEGFGDEHSRTGASWCGETGSGRRSAAIVEIGRPSLRVHDWRYTYASLARRAGADLRMLQKTMRHASITVTAHIYADLCDDERDVVASALDALDALDDTPSGA